MRLLFFPPIPPSGSTRPDPPTARGREVEYKMVGKKLMRLGVAEPDREVATLPDTVSNRGGMSLKPEMQSTCFAMRGDNGRPDRVFVSGMASYNPRGNTDGVPRPSPYTRTQSKLRAPFYGTFDVAADGVTWTAIDSFPADMYDRLYRCYGIAGSLSHAIWVPQVRMPGDRGGDIYTFVMRRDIESTAGARVGLRKKPVEPGDVLLTKPVAGRIESWKIKTITGLAQSSSRGGAHIFVEYKSVTYCIRVSFVRHPLQVYVLRGTEWVEQVVFLKKRKKK